MGKQFYIRPPRALALPLSPKVRTETGVRISCVLTCEGFMRELVEEHIPDAVATQDRERLQRDLDLYAKLWLAKQHGLTTLPAVSIPEGWRLEDEDGNETTLPENYELDA